MKHESAYYDFCFKEMKRMFNLPDEMFLELNDAFFDIASQQIELLRTALLQKDTEQLILHSHTIKGSSASLYHLSIVRIAEEIERHAKSKESFDYATAIFNLSEEIMRLRSLYMHWKPHQTVISL